MQRSWLRLMTEKEGAMNLKFKYNWRD